jgi:hypothetical protein
MQFDAENNPAYMAQKQPTVIKKKAAKLANQTRPATTAYMGC